MNHHRMISKGDFFIARGRVYLARELSEKEETQELTGLNWYEEKKCPEMMAGSRIRKWA